MEQNQANEWMHEFSLKMIIFIIKIISNKNYFKCHLIFSMNKNCANQAFKKLNSNENQMKKLKILISIEVTNGFEKEIKRLHLVIIKY